LKLYSFVQTVRGSFVQQIGPAKDVMRMEKGFELFSAAFEQNFVNRLSDLAKAKALADAVDYPF
jgi:hypothetical protein